MERVLGDSGVLKKYKELNALYKFKNEYFKNFYKYIIGIIQNPDGTTKNSGGDMDTYRLFLERCLSLVKKSGKVGMVIPSGLGKDDASTGLRRHIFDNVKIEGLIDFQNQLNNRKIFEGVDSRFGFGLLNIQNASPQDNFPCAFGVRDLKILEDFPDRKDVLIRSVEKIKRYSPRDVSIIEFKDPMDEKILLKAANFPVLGEEVEGAWNVSSV